MAVPSPHVIRSTRIPEIVLVVVSLAVIGSCLFPVYADSPPHPGTACISHLKQLALALQMYSWDEDERLPPKQAKWMDILQPYTKAEFLYHCPATNQTYGYALNLELAGKQISEINPDGTSFFETSLPGRSVWSDLFTLPKPGRHKGTSNVVTYEGRLIRVRE